MDVYLISCPMYALYPIPPPYVKGNLRKPVRAVCPHRFLITRPGDEIGKHTAHGMQWLIAFWVRVPAGVLALCLLFYSLIRA